jgi:hypothetical protein
MLTSWNDGKTKQAIVDFVARVTDEGGPDYVAPPSRIAVHDNDGTLWCEKPMPIQLDFTVRRLAEMARENPSLQDQQPYKAAYENDLHWMGAAMVKHYHGDDGDLKLLMGAVTAAFDEVSVEAYDRLVVSFFGEADHPTLKRPYRSCGFSPMVELLRYLEDNSFTNYIASGGDRDHAAHRRRPVRHTARTSDWQRPWTQLPGQGSGDQPSVQGRDGLLR